MHTADTTTSLNPLVIRDDNEQLPFGSVWTTDAAVGGGRRMDAPLFAGAFNGFDVRRFLAFLRTVKWAEPKQVQVMVRAPREDRWQLIDA